MKKSGSGELLDPPEGDGYFRIYHGIDEKLSETTFFFQRVL
jgi:hypothetical protein